MNFRVSRGIFDRFFIAEKEKTYKKEIVIAVKQKLRPKCIRTCSVNYPDEIKQMQHYFSRILCNFRAIDQALPCQELKLP